MSNSDRVNKDSIIAIVSFLTLVFSLVPILVLGFLNYATGDDLGYGAPGRAVIREGGNVIDFLKAAFESTAEEYYTWGGNWASGFFHRFEPSIFGERFYSITVIISVLALTIPAFLLLKEIFVNRFSLNFNTFLTVYSLMT
ncbi:MAG: hypothetical protein K6E33_00885, partial [Lachnospiraceae bacterium]|nr:hypothetical protein [Lachnospiraceae bacterium]